MRVWVKKKTLIVICYVNLNFLWVIYYISLLHEQSLPLPALFICNNNFIIPKKFLKQNSSKEKFYFCLPLNKNFIISWSVCRFKIYLLFPVYPLQIATTSILDVYCRCSYYCNVVKLETYLIFEKCVIISSAGFKYTSEQTSSVGKKWCTYVSTGDSLFDGQRPSLPAVSCNSWITDFLCTYDGV